ncbi:hypothetical protein SDC9_110085 [bioreactor metagenome]|uniref:Uncharacterized protein n=1 Tax=bioreactor metagenome TaxID=1076179 RepID=A0A645BCM8_9ZZZZ
MFPKQPAEQKNIAAAHDSGDLPDGILRRGQHGLRLIHPRLHDAGPERHSGVLPEQS